MEKPFELKDLEARLKAKGLVAVEGLAEIVAGELFDWLNESCLASDQSLVKTLGPAAIAVLKPMALAQIDKIDGQPG